MYNMGPLSLGLILVEHSASNWLLRCSASSSRSNQEIQTYAIALINALFLKAPEDRRQVRVQLSSTEYTQLTSLHWCSTVTSNSKQSHPEIKDR